MTTPLIWTGIKYQTILNSYLGSFPITWNQKKCRFKLETNVWKLKMYYYILIVFLMTFNLGAVNLNLLVRYLKPMKEFTTLYYLLFVILNIVIGMVLGIALAVFIYGERSVAAFNAIIDYQEDLNAQLGLHEIEFIDNLRDIPRHLKKADGNWDFFGMTILLFVAYGPVLPPALTFGAILQHLDPWYWLALEFLPSSFMSNVFGRIALAVPSFIVLCLNTALSVRLFQTMCIFFAVPLHMYTKVLLKLQKLFDRCRLIRHYDRLHVDYTQMIIMNNFVGVANGPESFATVEFSRHLGVVLLFTVLKLYSYVPLLIYFVCFAALIFILAMQRLTLFEISQITARYSDTLHDWKARVDPKSRYLRQRMRILTPMKIYASILGYKLYEFDTDAAIKFLVGIVDQTINLMVTLDESFYASISAE